MRCRWRRGHRCAGGARQYRWRHLVNGREAARSSEWAQHFSNASCLYSSDHLVGLIGSCSLTVRCAVKYDVYLDIYY